MSFIPLHERTLYIALYIIIILTNLAYTVRKLNIDSSESTFPLFFLSSHCLKYQWPVNLSGMQFHFTRFLICACTGFSGADIQFAHGTTLYEPTPLDSIWISYFRKSHCLRRHCLIKYLIWMQRFVPCTIHGWCTICTCCGHMCTINLIKNLISVKCLLWNDCVCVRWIRGRGRTG